MRKRLNQRKEGDKEEMGNQKAKGSVAIRMPDGSMESIRISNYCDPEQVGVILLKGYKDKLKIWQMIQLGDLISIGWDIGEKIPGAPEMDNWDESMYHEIRMIQNRQCLSHHRDMERPWEDHETKRYKNKAQWAEAYADRHRYYFVTSTLISKGEGEWFYDPPGRRYNEEKGREMPYVGRLLRWEIDVEKLLSNMKKIRIADR